MIRNLLVLAFLLLSYWSLAQSINLRGQVLDRNTKEPVPFVNIRLNDFYYGTSTNLDGRFELKLTPERFKAKDLLRITCIGYQTLIFELAPLDPALYQTVYLDPVSTELQAVTIKSPRARRRENVQAKTVVMNAMGRVPQNRPKNHFLSNAFYRHYCKEDDTYVRLIEAGLDIYQSKKDKQFVQIPEQKLAFEVTQLRRSFDFTASSKLEHTHFSLNFLLSNDITAYEFHNPLRRNLDQYEFSFMDTTQLDNEEVLIIDFEPRELKAGQTNYEGTLYIETKKLAFLRADITERTIRKSKIDSTHTTLKKQVFFQKIGGALYPDRVISDLEAYHFSIDSVSAEITDQVRHEAHVELMNNAIFPKNRRAISGKEPTQQALRKITYDSVFWNNYTVLKATPLEEKIIQDLSEKMTLNKQFESFNKLEEGTESVIKTPEFKAILDQYAGTPTYVVLWAGWSVPNFYELIASTALRKLIKKEKINFVMVSLDDNDADWEMNRDLNGLNLTGVKHHRLDFEFTSDIIRKFFGNVLPSYLLFDLNGEVYDKVPPLPNAAEVKDYYATLLRIMADQSSEKR